MVVSHVTASMHWETKAKFLGQVKPVGIENSMSWKMGAVHFDYDAGSGSWMAKLYFKVNPTKVYHQMKIQKPDNVDMKCGRLMIEDKNGNGIHIRLSKDDNNNARLLLSAIKNSMTVNATSNRAEVGLTVNASMIKHKGSENVNPFCSQDYEDLTLFQPNGGMSPEYKTDGLLSKKTPPMKNKQQHALSKRRLDLFSPERESGRYPVKNEKEFVSSPSFTGMKDYSKRNLIKGENVSLTNGLGARSFYGSQNSLLNNDCSSFINNRSFERSPANKKQKLSTPSLTSPIKKMSDSRICESVSPPQTKDVVLSGDTPTRRVQTPKWHYQVADTVGFQNLGNTCFLNSPLQCLSSLEPLSLDIQSAVAQYGMELNRNSMTRKLYLLMKDVRTLDVCPEHVKELLIKLRTDMNVKFAPNTQQDAHELLSEVLNRVDEEVKAAIKLHVSSKPLQSIQDTSDVNTASEKDQIVAQSCIEKNPVVPNSIFTPTEANFSWSYRTDIFFHECKTQVLSSQTEQEMTLMLAFDSNTKSLQDCINKYFESTEVEMRCEKCGKEEKATITRKIVRRPRVFILNLLRYRSDNMDTTKKADDIHVSSYISVHGYCTEDVKMPTRVDPVFMLDRIRTNSQNCERSPTASEIKKQGVKVDVNSSISMNNGSKEDISPIRGIHREYNDFSLLSDFIDSNLRSLDQYLAEVHENRDDITELYDNAQTMVSELNETIITQAQNESLSSVLSGHFISPKQDHELSLIEALLKKLLNLEDCQWVLQFKNLFREVIADLLTRYNQCGSTESNIDFLIEDLSLYITLLQFGILKSVNIEQQVIVDSLRAYLEKLEAHHNDSPIESFEEEFQHQNDDTRQDIMHLTKAVSFKEDVSYFDDLDVSFNNWKNTQVDKHSIKSYKSSGTSNVVVEELYKDAWLEKNLTEKSSGDTSSRTNYAYNPGSSGQVLQGKEINLYTEADLHEIDVQSLTEDEMMIYAQALSRFEYEKEQSFHVDNAHKSHPGLLDSFNNDQDNNADTFEELPDLMVSCEDKCLHKGLKTSGAESDSNINGKISPLINDTSILSSTKATMDVTSHPSKQSQVHKSNLICQESINFEEIDGYITSCTSKESDKEVSARETCRSDQASQPQDLSDENNSGDHKCSVSCDCLSTAVSSLNQTDLASGATELQTHIKLCDLSKEQLSQSHAQECKTSTNHDISINISECLAEGNVSEFTIARVCSPMKRSAKDSIDKNCDNLSHINHSGSKKEYFCSNKTSNLVKTRDYARLKSPGVSPKKKINKGHQPKLVAVTKWLQHDGENKSRKSCTEREESFSGEDCSAVVSNTSMEVNINDASFLDNINNSPFVDPSVLTINHSTPFSTAKTSTRIFSSSLKNFDDSNQTVPTSTSKVALSTSTPSAVEEANIQQMQQQNNQLLHMQIDQLEISVQSRKGNVSEKIQESIESEHSFSARNKTSRAVPDFEEKENMPEETAKANHHQMKNLEKGMADLSYKLVGIVDHTGSSQYTGHYTAYTFNMRKQKWFHLNDSETEMVTEEEVQQNNTQTGYLFFYLDK